MKRLSALLPVLLFSIIGAEAQYCSPTFSNGCSNWKVIGVSIGSSFNWTYTDCTVWDQTASIAIVDPADSIPMTVETGTWAGCTVWVDWDNSNTFETSENLYHIYIGDAVSYVYGFNIGVPQGTPNGQYRMRVIGAWGSDGFTDGSGNGFGPCGSYQYGSFNDFTLQVGLTTSTVDLGHRNNTITASPNPTSGLVVLSQARGLNAQDRFALQGIDGRMVRAWDTIGTGPLEIDLSDVPAGIYFVRNCTDANVRPLRIVKK